MKANGKLVFSIVLGAIAVGALVLLGMPFIIENASFLMGVITGVVVVSVSLVLRHIVKRKYLAKRQPANRAAKENPVNPTDKPFETWMLASVLIVLGGIVAGFVVFKQNEIFKNKALFQRIQITQQAELIEAARIKSMVVLMQNVLDKVDEELEKNPKRILSDETIGRIAALGYSFKPYTYYEGDSLLERKLSPERGQLLLALSNMNIDTSSLRKIMVQTQFAGADLREAELRGAYLRQANLNGANLRGANLQGANFSEADLWKTDLWGADLQNAELNTANMKRANLGWADLTEASFKGTNLNGANLTSVKLRRANMDGALVQWVDMSGAFLEDANLSGADFFGTNLEKAHLRDANLSKAKLIITNLTGADLAGVELSEATLTKVDLTDAVVSDKNWFTLLDEWEVTGLEEIIEGFIIVDDKSGDQSRYRLKKIEK